MAMAADGGLAARYSLSWAGEKARFLRLEPAAQLVVLAGHSASTELQR